MYGKKIYHRTMLDPRVMAAVDNKIKRGVIDHTLKRALDAVITEDCRLDTLRITLDKSPGNSGSLDLTVSVDVPDHNPTYPHPAVRALLDADNAPLPQTDFPLQA